MRLATIGARATALILFAFTADLPCPQTLRKVGEMPRLHHSGKAAASPGEPMETTTFEATFREGVLCPDRPLRLEPGQRVTVTVRGAAVASRWDFSRLGVAPSAEEAALTNLGIDDWATALAAEDAA